MSEFFRDTTNRLVNIAKEGRAHPAIGDSPYEISKSTIHSVITRQAIDIHRMSSALEQELLADVAQDPLVGMEVPILTKKEVKQKTGYIVPVPPNWNKESFARAERLGIPELIEKFRAAINDLETLRNLHHKHNDTLFSLGYAMMPRNGNLIHDILMGMRLHALQTVFSGKDYSEMLENFAQEIKNSSSTK